MLRTHKTRLAAFSLAAFASVALASPALAGGICGVQNQGPCSGNSDWKLKPRATTAVSTGEGRCGQLTLP